MTEYLSLSLPLPLPLVMLWLSLFCRGCWTQRALGNQWLENIGEDCCPPQTVTPSTALIIKLMTMLIMSELLWWILRELLSVLTHQWPESNTCYIHFQAKRTKSWCFLKNMFSLLLCEDLVEGLYQYILQRQHCVMIIQTLLPLSHYVNIGLHLQIIVVYCVFLRFQTQ